MSTPPASLPRRRRLRKRPARATRPPLGVGLRLHDEMQLPAGHDLLVTNERAHQGLAVESDGSYIPIGIRQIVHADLELFAIRQVQDRMIHEGTANDVFTGARRDRIKAERPE